MDQRKKGSISPSVEAPEGATRELSENVIMPGNINAQANE